MSKIVYTVTSSTMGDAAESDAQMYAAALLLKLQSSFPSVDVSVELNSRLSSSRIETSDDIDRNDVDAVAQALWNNGGWYRATE